MAKSTWDGKVPFHPDTGDLMHFPEDVYDWDPVEKVSLRRPPEWRDNIVWYDTLKFKGFSRGRSAANADFETTDGTSVTMFLTDLSDAIKQMVSGRLIGSFTYCKRGQNFGVKMVSPVPK